MKTQNCQSNPEGQKSQNRMHSSSRHQTVNSTVQHSTATKHIRINATESPGINPHARSQPSTKEADYDKWKSLQRVVLGKWTVTCKSMRLEFIP